MKNTVQAIILAAGKSTRFSTEKTKLATPICGKPMILFSTELLQSLDIQTTVVVGHEHETLKNIILSHHSTPITFIQQEKQLGTGHALACTESSWHKDNILVINGDMPLINVSTIQNLYNQHQHNNATVSFVSSYAPDAHTAKPYGRVVSTNDGIEIIEAKDLTGNPADFRCINAGIYLIKRAFLINYISTLNNNNANKEFYITDLIKIASTNKHTVINIDASFDNIRGVNTLPELMIAEKIKQYEIIHHWINCGVQFSSYDNTHVDADVTIGKNCFIASNVHLQGKTYIGENVRINPFSIITDSIINAHSEVNPFTYLKNNTLIKTTLSHHKDMEDAILSHKKTKPYLATEQKQQESSAFSFMGARLVNHDIPADEQ